jgi:hypothetical protein
MTVSKTTKPKTAKTTAPKTPAKTKPTAEKKENLNTTMTNTTVETNTSNISNETSLKIHGFPVIGQANILVSQIKRDYNIRFQTNVQKVDDIYDSIRENGVSQPIYINSESVALDGYRRLFCCDKIINEGTGDFEVPVIYIDVPYAEIPLFQARCGSVKHISESEYQAGIIEHAKRNPNLSNRAIASLFGKSSTIVNQILYILREAPNLSQEVNAGVIPQMAAKKLIEAAKQSGKKADAIWSEEIKPKILAQKSEAENKPVEELQNLPLSGRTVNKAIRDTFPDIKLTSETKPQAEPAAQTIPGSKKALRNLWVELQFTENSTGGIELSGVIDKLLFQQIEALLSTKTSPLTESTSDAPNTSLDIIEVSAAGISEYDVWTKQAFNGLTIIQSGQSFISFESDAVEISEILNNPVLLISDPDEGDVDKVVLTKAEFNKLKAALIEIEQRTKLVTYTWETKQTTEVTEIEDTFTLEVPSIGFIPVITDELVEVEANESNEPVQAEPVDIESELEKLLQVDSSDLADDLDEIQDEDDAE